MEKSIFWIQHGGERKFIAKLLEYLADRNYRNHFFCFLENDYIQYRENLRQLSYDLIGDIEAIEPPNIESIEMEYSPYTLAEISLSDSHFRSFFGKNQSEITIKFVAKLLVYWKKKLSDFAPEAIILRDQASIWCRTAVIVARKHYPGIKILQIGLGPDDKHFAIYNVNTHSVWTKLIEMLEHRNGTRLNQTQKDYVDQFVANRFVVSHDPMVLRGPGKFSYYSRVILGSIKRIYLNRNKEFSFSQAFNSLVLYNYRKNVLWHLIYKRIIKYDNATNERYIYFPLFHREELVNLLNSRYISENVVNLIEYISSILPINVKLYIKEHPVVLGDLTLSEILRIKRLKNVRLIHPSARSSSLIHNSLGVICVGGTAGWEALLAKKRIINLSGSPFYSYCSFVTVIEDFQRIYESIHSITYNSPEWDSEEIEEWYTFIYCVLSSVPEGRFYNFEYPHKMDISHENTNKVAKAIIMELSKE